MPRLLSRNCLASCRTSIIRSHFASVSFRERCGADCNRTRRSFAEGGVLDQNVWKPLALMAGGALLGVKILRRDAEHVVTLNANTMKNGLPGRRSMVLRVVRLRLRRIGWHIQILAYRRAPQHLPVF